MLKMGCSRADITPGFKCFLRGYASRTELTDKVEDPIEAGIIALEQPGRRQLIITLDSLGMSAESCVMVKNKIHELYSIAPQDVVIACSHTHFAPEINNFVVASAGGMPCGIYPADDYRDFWLERVMPAIAQALGDLEEVELFQSEAALPCVVFNRRTVRKSDGLVTTNYIYPQDPENYDFSPIDPTMYMWKFMRGTHTKAVLVRFSCHAVTGGYDGNAISADFPGAFRRSILSKMACPAFFMNGTAGDVVPLQRNGTSRQDIGEVMANAVKLAARTFKPAPDFQLKSISRNIKVTAPDLVGKTNDDVQTMYQKALTAVQAKERGYDQDFYLAGRLYNLYNNWQGSEGDLPLQIIQLGSKFLVCLPFDVLTDIGQNIAQEHPEAVVVGYSGGGTGYVFMPEDAPKGGYETTVGTSLTHDTGKKFVDAAIELISQLKQ
ncbi:MAG: hypothetical protein E7052_03860 [Lentisphaerae bacterium]|nr:hypothetical protein [Lentisphaerota bacterium]